MIEALYSRLPSVVIEQGAGEARARRRTRMVDAMAEGGALIDRLPVVHYLGGLGRVVVWTRCAGEGTRMARHTVCNFDAAAPLPPHAALDGEVRGLLEALQRGLAAAPERRRPVALPHTVSHIACGRCRAPLLAAGRRVRVKGLPGRHWRDLVDCWSCHRSEFSVVTGRLRFSTGPAHEVLPRAAGEGLHRDGVLIVAECDLLPLAECVAVEGAMAQSAMAQSAMVQTAMAQSAMAQSLTVENLTVENLTVEGEVVARSDSGAIARGRADFISKRDSSDTSRRDSGDTSRSNAGAIIFDAAGRGRCASCANLIVLERLVGEDGGEGAAALFLAGLAVYGSGDGHEASDAGNVHEASDENFGGDALAASIKGNEAGATSALLDVLIGDVLEAAEGAGASSVAICADDGRAAAITILSSTTRLLVGGREGAPLCGALACTIAPALDGDGLPSLHWPAEHLDCLCRAVADGLALGRLVLGRAGHALVPFGL